MLRDAFGRTVEYMRVSVTDRCNLRCRYCMPEGGVALLTHDDVLRFGEIEAVVRAAVELGVRSIRLTGGEPLVKRGILELVRGLGAIAGLEDLALTTNGVLLEPMARELKAAGLRRVNLGIPSLDSSTWSAISRCPEELAPRARAAIEAALAAGLTPVKVNVVLLRGTNDDPTPWLDLVRRLPIEVRFIEFMPMGPSDGADLLVPSSETEARLRAASDSPWERTGSEAGRGPVKETWRVGGSPGTIGFIHAMSDHFCARCNRLRLTSDGHLRTCLFSDDEVDLKPALRPAIDEERLRALLREAVASKPRCIPVNPRHGRRWMGQVGG